MIKLKNCEIEKDGITISEDISLEIKENKLNVITSDNVMNMSSVLLVCALLEPIKKGSITYKEKEVKNIYDDQIIKLYKSKFSYGNYNIGALINETVQWNLEYVLKNKNNSNNEIKKKVKKVMGIMGILDIGKKKFMLISLAEKQKVAMAKILLINPKVIFLDNQLNYLEIEDRKKALDIIKKFNSGNKTLVIASKNHEIIKIAANLIKV